MDASSSSTTLLRPRLRLFRRNTSPHMPDGALEMTPRSTFLSTRLRFSAAQDEEDEFPTPRMRPKLIASDSTPRPFLPPASTTPIPVETPAARLRALLARELRSPTNVIPVPPSAPSSDVDSVAGSTHLSSSTSSITRDSLKDIFSRVLREPEDTPPHDLPDLPGSPSSSDDDILAGTPAKDQHIDVGSNFTLTKTPKPPGAWAATPLPPKPDYRSSSPPTFFPLDSTPPASTSTPLPHLHPYLHMRTEAETDNSGEDELLTPARTTLQVKSLPLRTPLPPGAWVATPGQSALLTNGVDQSQYGLLGSRKGPLKVRFDVSESETSVTEEPNSPVPATRWTNTEFPSPRLITIHESVDNVEMVVNGVHQSTLASTVSHRPATPEHSTTPISGLGLSPRSLRKSPVVRLVDAYGQERVEEEGTRIHRSLEADVSVISDDIPVGRAEALACMRKTLGDLTESLSKTDRSDNLKFDSSRIKQLEEVSKAARLARHQLAHSLHLETTRHHDLCHDKKFSAWTRGLLPVTKKSFIIYCGIIIQLLFFLAMWRYAHAEARRLFYTTYYDPLYPEFTPIRENPCFSGIHTTSRSWTIFDSYETIRREGWWSVRKEILGVMRHFVDQVWERWGEDAYSEKPT